MALKLIKELLDAQGNKQLIKGSNVVDEASGVTFEGHVADKTIHLTEADVNAKMAALTATVNDFLTGDANGGEMDRLVELVTAIGENKGSIDALVSDKATKEELATLQEQVDDLEEGLHSHTNQDILDGIGKDAAGDLTYNGKTLDGATSVAFVANSSDTPVFDGKLVMVVAAYNEPTAE